MQTSVKNCSKIQKSCKENVVYSKNLKNGCSSNWKADWARFTGKTYAQVVKAKNDLEGRMQIQSKQPVISRQFKPTALVRKHKAVPVTEQVKYKKVTNMPSLKKIAKKSDTKRVILFNVKPKIDSHFLSLLLRVQIIVLTLSQPICQKVHLKVANASKHII